MTTDPFNIPTEEVQTVFGEEVAIPSEQDGFVLPPLPLVDGHLFIDNSMLEAFTTCSRLLQYSQLYRRISAAEKPALNFGTALHKALEHRYRVYGSRFDPAVEAEQEQILAKFFDEHPCPIDDFRNLNWAIEVNRRYNLKYQLETFQVLAKGKDILAEVPFALPFYETTSKRHGPIKVMYSGVIDLPIYQYEMLDVMDHKSTKIMGKQFFEKGRMLAAQKGYCWAFRQVTGMPVQGYVINGIRVKEPPIKTLTNGKSAVAKWWDESFARERYPVTDDDIDEWIVNTKHLIDEFIWRHDRDFMPMKTAWCTVYGKCQYYDVCTLPREDRLAMLGSNLYTENKWSPLRSPSQPAL